MNKKLACLCIFVSIALTALFTVSAAVPEDGEVVSTSIIVNNQAFGVIRANSTLFYYWNGNSTESVTESTPAHNIQPFAYIEMGEDKGSIRVNIGENNSLPKASKLLVDDDRIPDLNISEDPNQIQIQGNGSDTNILYSGVNSTNKIYCEGSGKLYVFLNTGDAARGNIKVDIKLTV